MSITRRRFISSAASIVLASALAETGIGWATTSSTASASPTTPEGTFNVLDYGARCDGVTDDAPAIDAAFAAMRNDQGHPDGTLHIPGGCRVANTLDLDCGYAANPASNSLPAAGGPERFVLTCDGLIPDAGTGTAIRLHHGYNVDAFVRLIGGGQATDVGLYVDALSGCHVAVEAQQFRGTVLKADGANGVCTARNWSLNVQKCGKAIDFRGINAFGWFDDIWDSGCTNGSTFEDCADIGIGHYENWSPATQTVGLSFKNCNMMNLWVVSLGDRATTALMEIEGGDFGSIGKLRATGVAEYKPGAGLIIKDVKTINIGTLITGYCPKGLYIQGCGKAIIGQHQSLTGDDVPLYIDKGATLTAPVVHVQQALYNRCNCQACYVAKGVRGGRLVIGGEIELEGIAATGPFYTFQSRSPGFHIYTQGLHKVRRTWTRGAFGTPNNRRLVHVTGGAVANNR